MLYFLLDYADVALGIHSSIPPDKAKRIDIYGYISDPIGFKAKHINKLNNWWWIADINHFPNMRSHQYEEWDRLVSDDFISDLADNIKNVIKIADKYVKQNLNAAAVSLKM